MGKCSPRAVDADPATSLRMGFGEGNAGTLRFRSGLAHAGEEGPEVKAFRLDEVRSGRSELVGASSSEGSSATS